MKLTDLAISRFTYAKDGNKQDIRWDDHVKGLGVRVYPTGRKVYVLCTWVDGKRTMSVLGDIEHFATVENARQKALSEIEKSKLTQAPPSLNTRSTVAEIFQRYKELRISRMTQSSGHEEARRILKHIVGRWGNKPLLFINQIHLLELHKEISKTGKVEANRVIQAYRRLFNRSKEWGLIPKDIICPADFIIENVELKRDRFVDVDEMPKLLNAINRIDNEYVRALLWLYLLTGARKRELMNCKWEDFLENTHQLRLRHTKNGSEFYIELSDDAFYILSSLKKREGNDYLFPCRDHRVNAPLNNIAKSWNKVREEAGLSDVTIHDLRRTVASWMVQNGHSIELVGKVLNHNNLKSTSIYARFGKRMVRDALQDNTQRITNLVKPKTA